MTDLRQLRRVRWAVRSALVLGVAATVCGNVLHAWDRGPVAWAISAWAPLALLIAVELIAKVPVHRRLLAVARLAATLGLAGIAAWVSYWHLVFAAAHYGETGAAPYLLPLSVDGLVVVAAVSLVELGGRIAAATAAPPVATLAPPAAELPAGPTEPEHGSGTDHRSPDTDSGEETPADRADAPSVDSPAEPPPGLSRGLPPVTRKVAKLRQRHPDKPRAELAVLAGMSERTLDRHLRAIRTATEAATEPVNGRTPDLARSTR